MGNLGAQIYHSPTQLRPAFPMFCHNGKLGITTTSVWVLECRFATRRPPTHLPFGCCVVTALCNHNISVHFREHFFICHPPPPNWRRNPNKSAERSVGLFFADFCIESCDITIKRVVVHVATHRNPQSPSFVTQKFVLLFFCNERGIMENQNGWPNGHSTRLSCCTPGFKSL